MLKFLASLSSCKTILRIAEQRSVRGVKTRKSAGKPNAEWFVRERTVKSNSEKSSGSLNCFSFLTGLGIKANSTKCKSAILICLTAFSSDYPPISDLIHLARCVKFNPQFNPWMVLIGLRGTEFNRKINLLRGFGRFNLGLALIGFRTTGAWLRPLGLIVPHLNISLISCLFLQSWLARPAFNSATFMSSSRHRHFAILSFLPP